MYQPAVYNFKIYAGATFNLSLTWRDENDLVFDLTGYSGVMQIRDKIDSAVLFEFNSDDDTIVFGSVSPNIIISMSAAQSATLDFVHRSAVYDLLLTGPGPSFIVTRLLEGKAYLKPAVTE